MQASVIVFIENLLMGLLFDNCQVNGQSRKRCGWRVDVRQFLITIYSTIAGQFPALQGH